MKKLLYYFVSIILLSPSIVCYADNELIKFKDFIKQIESKENKLQVSAFAILYKGKIVHKRVFGKSRLGEGEITEQTLFSLASVSKAVTAIAIAKLIDEKKLQLDEVFELKALQEKTTLRQLLSHTTGYKIRGDYEIEKGLNFRQITNIIKHQKKSCKNCYNYSNVLFNLNLEILKQRELSLQMALDNLNIIGIDTVPLKNENIATYSHSQKTKIPLLYSKYAITVPASAGIYSSLDGAIELLLLASGYKEGITQHTLNEFFTPYSTVNDVQKWGLDLPKSTKYYYGLGWRILKINLQDSLIFHSGSTAGIFAFIGFMPSKNIGVIFMSNGFNQKVNNMQNIMDFFIHFVLD